MPPLTYPRSWEVSLCKRFLRSSQGRSCSPIYHPTAPVVLSMSCHSSTPSQPPGIILGDGTMAWLIQCQLLLHLLSLLVDDAGEGGDQLAGVLSESLQSLAHFLVRLLGVSLELASVSGPARVKKLSSMCSCSRFCWMCRCLEGELAG